MLCIQCQRAKIVRDQLLICVEQTLAGTREDMQRVIDEGRYKLCMHAATDPNDLMCGILCERRYRPPESEILQLLRELNPSIAFGREPELRPWERPVLLRECHMKEASCRECLTDFGITMARFHITGSGRSEQGVEVSTIDLGIGRIE